jgi:hypothetical protein
MPNPHSERRMKGSKEEEKEEKKKKQDLQTFISTIGARGKVIGRSTALQVERPGFDFQ